MTTARIKLREYPIKEPRIREDGNAEIIFKHEMSEQLPKGFVSLGSTNYLVYVSGKMLNRLGEITTSTLLEVHGEVKASVTKKGVPVVVVIANLIEKKNADKVVYEKKSSEKLQQEKDETKKSTLQKINIAWYEMTEITEKFVLIDPKLVYLKDPIHLDRTDIWHYKIKYNPADVLSTVIKPEVNGTYSLLIGFTSFLKGKIYNQKLSAYIYEGTREEFIREYKLSFETKI